MEDRYLSRDIEARIERDRQDPTYHGLGAKFQKFLDDHGVIPQRIDPEDYSCRIGFSEREQKWYGWSHRAVYGFGIGSTCKKGDCHYTADNVDELYDDHLAFFDDIIEGDDPASVDRRAEARAKRAARLTKNYAMKCVHVGVEHIAMPMANSIAGVQAEMSAPGTMPVVAIPFGGHTIHVGKGAWEAKTLDDAKQMAIDFAESVS